MFSRTRQKHFSDLPSRQKESPSESPLSGGMPSLVDGASRKDLPEAMRTKMENAFGADLMDYINSHMWKTLEKARYHKKKPPVSGNGSP